ncbi:MAG: peptide chain release factor N(5)-glutamine methyltransferase [Verrucomicrobia bacterium]|nr:peptide chain release factor N(5)-glutamine methyltransferase [Verrucomicrobiota bacterium]MDA1065189.1 peptide chain release factor N(5)-glutamine methyltransferase [Verrucomicrobiota bacterium]
MITLLEVLQKSTSFLNERGVEDAKISTEWIMAESLGLQRLDLYLQFERPLTEQELVGIRKGIKRRANREPLQYILGTIDFYNVQLKIDPRALIPRPETEYLVELLHTRYLNKEPTRILDLGTGSGAIAIALLSVFPNSLAVAVDQSEPALELATENAKSAGVIDRLELVASDWFENVEGEFELIIANPPYLTSAEMESAEPEVLKFEPRGALYGGDDGQDDLNCIVDESFSYLANGGMLVLETGIHQHADLMARAKHVGFVAIQSVKDLGRRDRFLIGLK